MRIFADKSQCCGCGACARKCPKAAITMVKDDLGFIYPRIDEEKCINCGLCARVCAFQKHEKQEAQVVKAYAAAAKDDSTLKNSSSGGIFAELAKEILSRGGTVFGAAWNEDFSVRHTGVTREADLIKLQGSKYVHSRTDGIYQSVRSCLEQGMQVLYSGTPCQVAALYSFLGKAYPNLYTVDLICHGVCSEDMLQADLHYVGKGEKVESVSFRDKGSGWGTDGALITDRRKIRYSAFTSPYYFYFLKGVLFRESCYQCPYPGSHRPADITLGDYWGIESAHPDIGSCIEVQKGISCVLANTAKGDALLQSLGENVVFVESEYEKIKSRNGNLAHASQRNGEYKAVFEAYRQDGYPGLVAYWKQHERKSRMVLRAKSLIPFSVRQFIKKKRG